MPLFDIPIQVLMGQLMLGLPAAAIQVFQGMLLFFLLALDLLTNFRVRMRKSEVA